MSREQAIYNLTDAVPNLTECQAEQIVDAIVSATIEELEASKDQSVSKAASATVDAAELAILIRDMVSEFTSRRRDAENYVRSRYPFLGVGGPEHAAKVAQVENRITKLAPLVWSLSGEIAEFVAGKVVEG